MSKVKFGDVVRETKEKVDRSNNPYEFYVAGDHMDTEDLTIRRKGRFATDDVGPAFVRVFHEGQVLYGSRRTYLKKIAVADFDGVTANTTFVLETKDENMLRQRLIPFIMYTEKFTEWSVKKSKGSTNPYVLFSDLADYEFDLPPIEKQDELVELLWSMVEAKEAYQELLQQTDELVKSRFIEMFGDAIENEMGWSQMPLCKVLAEGCTVTYGIVKTEDDIPNGVPVFRPVDISQGHIPTRSELKRTSQKISDCYRRTLLQGDEILITVRGSIGETFQICDEFAGCNVARNIVPLRANPRLLSQGFLKAVLDSAAFQRRLSELTKGVALKGINMNEFKMCPVILPPLPRQEQFLTFQSQSDKSKFELGQAVKTLEAVYNKIISENLN